MMVVTVWLHCHPPLLPLPLDLPARDLGWTPSELASYPVWAGEGGSIDFLTAVLSRILLNEVDGLEEEGMRT